MAVAVVIALLVAAGAAVAVWALTRGGGTEATVDECVIEPDGALAAAGTIRSDGDVDATVEVRFEDRDTGTEVDRDTIEVRGSAGTTIEWSAAGQAGEDVDRVTCVLGPLE